MTLNRERPNSGPFVPNSESRPRRGHYLLNRDPRIFMRLGPLPEIQDPLRTQLREHTPRRILSGWRREVTDIDVQVHTEEEQIAQTSTPTERIVGWLGDRIPQQAKALAHRAKELSVKAAKGLGTAGRFLLTEFFWNIAILPNRGRFWPKVNMFYDHPETGYQQRRLKWALKYTLEDQLPKGILGRFFQRKIPSYLDKNRLRYQIPLYTASLFVPFFGALLSIPTNLNNTIVAFAHGEIRKGIANLAFTGLDLLPLAAGLIAGYLALTGMFPVVGAIVGFAGFNAIASLLPTQTMLNEPFQNAYTEAFVGDILRIVSQETDPVKRLQHDRAIMNFLEDTARRFHKTPHELRDTLLESIRDEISDIGDSTTGKIKEQRDIITAADHEREQLRRRHYKGKILVLGNLILRISKAGKYLNPINGPFKRRLMAEMTLSNLERQKESLELVREILSR